MRTPLEPTITTLPATPQTAAAARDYARHTIARYAPAMPADRIHDLCLVVSELVSNAIRYGTEPGVRIGLGLVVRAAHTRVEVHDPVRRRPRPRTESSERTRGRGLLAVTALAESWGTEDRPMGKVVWAELVWAASRKTVTEPDAALNIFARDCGDEHVR
ncbi:ATP-binding protein [Streptomyces sp. RK75]|uniref:ATP-binding protein n=1 Tax=Streptomyces sp. RK75 TaxID=2824895 RepID=UPI001B373B88|nr:ATP-binding protein [Streptomyces sp. RK75]MBQ0868763.1 ATP-binding protein [Streptomyces sp. RK75]